jgi:hypothetical protein
MSGNQTPAAVLTNVSMPDSTAWTWWPLRSKGERAAIITERCTAEMEFRARKTVTLSCLTNGRDGRIGLYLYKPFEAKLTIQGIIFANSLEKTGSNNK